MTESLAITSIQPESRREWDQFIREQPGSSVFHLFGWRDVVQRSFGGKAHYLAARSSRGELVGVLPLFEVRTLAMKRGLISLPYAIRGGPVATSDQAVDALIDAAQGLAERLGSDYLELRAEELETERLQRQTVYVTFQADLTSSDEELLGNMQRKRRQMMNYAKRAGYQAWTAKAERLDLFYSLFSRSMRSHGTPVYPKRFIRAIMECLADEALLYFVDHDGVTLAGVLCLNFRDVLLPMYAGTDRDRRPRGLDDFTYWSMMQWGREQGYRVFDFGRSRVGTGPYRFKSRWGMTEVPLDYHHQAVGTSEVPNLRPDNPRFESLIRAWRKLPLPLTRVLGPPVAKRLP